MGDDDMTVQEAGRRGGKKTLERHGLEHYHEIGVKGGASVREKYGHEFYTEIGTKGGTANLAKHGPEHYSDIGIKGGAARVAKYGREAIAEAAARVPRPVGRAAMKMAKMPRHWRAALRGLVYSGGRRWHGRGHLTAGRAG